MINSTILTPWLTRAGGGLQSSVRDLVLSLVKARHINFTTIGLIDDYIAEDFQYWKGASVRMHRFYGPSSFRFSPGQIYDVATMDVDFVQLHGVWMSPSFSMMIRNVFRKNTPLLVSPHGMLDPWIVNRNSWKKTLARSIWENSVWRSASAFRALNTEEAIAIRGLLPNKPIYVIPNGINAVSTDVFESLKAPRMRAAPVLLYLGRLHEKKCVLELIKAWQKFKVRSKSDWLLQIAGWGDEGYTQSVTSLIAEIGEPTITFLGPVFGAQKHRVLSEASAFILPSRSEGLPISVLEACTYGLLPIISKDCNLPELVTNHSALSVGTEVDEIADALSNLNAMPLASIASVGEGLHKYVSNKYNWDDIAKQFIAVQEWCIGGGSPPPGLFE